MRISLAVVVAAAVVVACAVGSHRGHHAPSGYERIGTTDGATVYARQTRSDGDDWLDVILQSRDGDQLCNARGPLSPVGAPALCDDHVPGAYAYAQAVAKGGPGSVARCERPADVRVVVPVVRTPEGWPVDLAVLVMRGADDTTSVTRC